MRKRFYKYRSLYKPSSDGSKEPDQNTQSIFTRAEIYFNAPENFNDPFDCNLRTHVADSTDAEWDAWFDEQIDSQLDPAFRSLLIQHKAHKAWELLKLKTDAELETWLDKNSANEPASRVHQLCLLREIRARLNDVGKSEQTQIYNKSSVFCLSHKGNSIPMFSYYADSHHGVAIEFFFSETEVPCGFGYDQTGKIGSSNEGRLVFKDLEYLPSFPELNFFKLRNRHGLTDNLIFKKFKEWSHEEEFRIFRHNIAKSPVHFEHKLMTKIIFGCKSTQVEVDLVRSWLKNWPSDVVFSKAEPTTDRFELLINDFDVVKGI